MENNKLRAIIVDDEKPSREALSNYIREFCQDVEIVADCNSVRTAYKSITENSPDVVFLDIEMPKGNGFDLLRKFTDIRFKIIFVTAFSDYAVQAFRFSATDYLLKPVKVSELRQAVEKVRNDIYAGIPMVNISTLLENFDGSPHLMKKLVIPDSKGFSVIDPAEVIYCVADGYCTVFHLSRARKETSSKNIGHYGEILSEGHFLRVHHSYLVNIHKVSGYSNQGVIYLSEGHQCPLGTTYRQNFLKHFKKFR